MATGQTSEVIQHLRRTVLLRDGAGLTDGQLLEDFLNRRDEAAMEVLVRRHGPMVWGVCRRVLRDHHDAEDAFQATFLVLVRKAASIASRELLATWLYGVAHQTALKARATVAKRKGRERQVTVMPEPAVAGQALRDDLQPVLDAELSRLPDKYRAVIVLCDLECKTRKEAARQLGLAEGTVASRLARGRTMLASRLARHGLAVSGGALAAVLSENVASAGVPTPAVSATIRAASVCAAGKVASAGVVSAKVAALLEGVLRTMFLDKLKTVIVTVLVMALLGVGGGVFVWRSQASDHPGQQSGKGESPWGKDQDIKKRLLELDELWWKGDVETLRKLAADDLITVSGVGRYDKASLLEASKNRHSVDWTRRDVEVSRVSKDVAIVTYLYDCKVVLSDGTLFQNCRDRRSSITWANRKGGWVAVFAQETILPGGE
jgi:RNA polymerase sigma factor (sigma-70 family)